MSVNLYDSSIAVYMRQLVALKKILQKGEAWCGEQGKPHSVLLEGKLAPDMLVQTCCNSAKLTMNRVGRTETAKFEDNETTFAQLYERIDKTVELLKTAKREDYNDTSMEIKLDLPSFKPVFTGLTYVQRFAVPNFFFHETTAYLILRSAGVPVGKADFLDGATIQDP